jgi:hypothetical protein
MANGNFVVQNGIQVGPLTIDVATGTINTSGAINVTGTAPQVSSANIVAASGTASSSTTTGALVVVGGAGISGAINVGGTSTIGGVETVNGNLVAAATTATSSTTTGALVVAGGAGIAGDLRVGGNLYAASLNTVSSQQLSVTAPLVYLTGNAYPYNYDIGMYSHFVGGPANVYSHTGVVRNYTSNAWSFFSNVRSEPAGTVNWADAGLAWDTIQTGHHLPGANVTYNLGSSTVWWNTFYGIATQAKYADLAENYQADASYAPGTVLQFGGDHEVTIASADTKAVAGVVSTNPAHLMNGGLQGMNVIPLALTGRVPCNVIGPIKKGDMLVSAGFGYAKTNNNPQVGQVIGKALADFGGAKGQIEVVVGRL